MPATLGWFESLMNRGATPAVSATWSFTHARHQVIAENIANASTPGYRAKQLDQAAFQRTLRRALDERGTDPFKPFVMDGRGSYRTDEHGRLQVTPRERPSRNILFHDGTNLSIESEMSDLAANAMLHELSTTLLQGHFDALQKSIRGHL